MRKAVFIVMLLLCLSSFVFYVVLFAPNTANYEWIMSLRYKYVQLFERQDFMQPTIRAMAKMPLDRSYYLYSFRGKLIGADDVSITMEGRGGKKYKFLMGWNRVGDGWVKHAGIVMNDVAMQDYESGWFTFNTSDILKSGELMHEPFDIDQIYGVMWKDRRTLAQIIEDYENNPDGYLYEQGSNLMYLVRYEK